MKVNFNNLRKQAIYACDRITEKLNRAIDKEGTITIEAEDIQKEMDDLRMLIGSVACVFEENNEEFKDVYSEVFPEDKEGRMKCFNDEEYNQQQQEVKP